LIPRFERFVPRFVVRRTELSSAIEASLLARRDASRPRFSPTRGRRRNRERPFASVIIGSSLAVISRANRQTGKEKSWPIAQHLTYPRLFLAALQRVRSPVANGRHVHHKRDLISCMRDMSERRGWTCALGPPEEINIAS